MTVDLAKHEALRRLYEQCAEHRAMWFKVAKELEQQVETLDAENARLWPVVEAALDWRNAPNVTFGSARYYALIDAIEAFERLAANPQAAPAPAERER